MTVRLPSFSKMKLPHLRRLAGEIGLVLVSASPRRRKILTEAGVKFESMEPSADETIHTELSPDKLVMELAQRKVESAVKDNLRAYLACDTIVVLGNKILTKPDNEADALRILKLLAGQEHSVFSGLALFDSRHGQCFEDFEESRVRFNHVTEQQLLDYIATGEPLDKAGAYGIQGMGGFLVDSVEGNIDNVVGLPMQALERLAARLRELYA
jgi:septum formation protein